MAKAKAHHAPANSEIVAAHDAVETCLNAIGWLLSVPKQYADERLLDERSRQGIGNIVKILIDRYPTARNTVADLWAAHRIPRSKPHRIKWGKFTIIAASVHDGLLQLTSAVWRVAYGAGLLHGRDPNRVVLATSSLQMLVTPLGRAATVADVINEILPAAPDAQTQATFVLHEERYPHFVAALKRLPTINLDQLRADLRLESSKIRPSSRDESRWITVSAAAIQTGASQSTISRAASNGAIKTNGQQRKARRLDSASLVTWSMNRPDRLSDSAIENKLGRLNRGLRDA